jgi:O-antigen/teichoic acid export membrane protein
LSQVIDQRDTVEPSEATDGHASPFAPRRSLRALVIRGSAWTLLGYGAAQVLRLGGNLVLTRLLAPEIFGVATLVVLFLQALEMFSDVGLSSSVVRSPRGDDAEYLSTVWTIQVIRGFALGFGAILIAWPAAAIYGTPALKWLIPVGGITAVAQGFCSVAVLRSNRHMVLGRLTVLELCAQALTLCATVLLAAVRPTVWALVCGGIIGAVAKAVLSFVMLPASVHRLTWDRSSAAEILHFGKWLTLSTILTFLANSGDRLVLGYVLTKRELGVYSIAFLMSQAVLLAVRNLSVRIFFPLYSRLGELDDAAVRARIGRCQVALLALVLPPICGLIVWGPRIVDLLYDQRYHNAGWMLRILAAGTIGAVITANAGSVVLAKGNSLLYLKLLAARSTLLLGSMLLGAKAYGLVGLIVGVAIEPLLCYPAMAFAMRRYGTWMPWVDFVAALGSAALVAFGLAFTGG